MKNLVATTKIMRSKVFKLIKLQLWLTFKPLLAKIKNFGSYDCTCGKQIFQEIKSLNVV